MRQAPAPHPRNPFGLAFWSALPHGLVAGISLPAPDAPGIEAGESRLFPEERALASELGGARRVTFIGGRLAVHDAMGRLRVRPSAVSWDEHGAPAGPRGLALSISHKRDLAVGLVALGTRWKAGVDVEDLLPPREHLADRILDPAELEALFRLAPERRSVALIVHFSLKEALYKAIHPFVRRYVEFHEVSLIVRTDGTAEATRLPESPCGPLLVELRHHWLPGRVLSTARARPSRQTEDTAEEASGEAMPPAARAPDREA